MIDLKLENGDIQFSDTNYRDSIYIPGSTSETYNDLITESGVEVADKLFKRLIITPLGHITLRVLHDIGTANIDFNIGNGIYQELSQPLNINLVNKAYKHISHAIKFKPRGVKVLSIDVLVPSFETVHIYIYYSINKKKYTYNKTMTLTDYET